MNKRLRLILGLSLIVLILAILLIVLFRDWVRLALVPFLYVVWWLSLLISALPQAFFWAILLVLTVYLAGKSLRAGRKPRLEEKTTSTGAAPGRVHVLMQWLQATSHSHYARAHLARHLGELAVEATTPRAYLTPGEIGQRLRVGNLSAPAEIIAYFQAGILTPPAPPTGLLATLRRLLQKTAPPATPLDLDPERVVQFLEEELEMEYDTHP